MESDEFRSDIINGIEAQSQEEGTYPQNIFVEQYCKPVLIEDYGAASDLEYLEYDKTPNNNKFRKMHIDGAYLETSANTLTLLYCDYNRGPIDSFNNEEVRSKIVLLENFVSNVLKGYFSETAESDPATELAHDIIKNVDDIFKIQLVYASTNKKAERIKQNWDLPPLEVGTKTFEITLIVLDIENIYQSFKGTDREKINIETKDFGYPLGIPCIEAEIESDDYKSYLAVVPGDFLADIYYKYNARLLESNVRSFLNTRGGVNKGILSTILNAKTRFFAYNNGIATTADSIATVTHHNGTYITKFDNFQIINGGQTTASLTSAKIKNKADLSGIFVQMKLSIIKNEDQADDLVRLISTYANTQNKVSKSDLNSNHRYFTRIETLSRKTPCPQLPNATYQTYWFFERSRGQYEQKKMLMSQGEKDRFDRTNPRGQRFTKTDLAKYINASDQNPQYVACGGEVNLQKFVDNIDKIWNEEKDGEDVNENYYKELIAKAIIYKAIDKMVLNSEWYKNDRAYKSAIVPYTFAKFVYEAKSKQRKELNYLKIWNQQSCLEEYMSDLEEIAFLVYKAINNPKRTISNIGEYAKRDACWEAIKNTPYNLSTDTTRSLVDPGVVKDAQRASRKDQAVTNSATRIVDVYNAGLSYWRKASEMGEILDFTYYQKSLCKKAIDYINSNATKFLTDAEIRDLGKIMHILAEYNINPGEQ